MKSGKIVTFGEIMLRLATQNNNRVIQSSSFDAAYGGSEANVAIALANFGFDVEQITKLPENPLGDTVISELRKHNVGTQFISRGGTRLGIYFLEVGKGCRASQVTYDREHSSFTTAISKEYNWEEIFKDAEWFHFTGISPALSESAYELTLSAVKAAHKSGLKISMDLNYRSKLWNWGKDAKEVLPELVKYCTIVLGNEEHMQSVLGIESLKTLNENQTQLLENICIETKKRFPNLETVSLSIRKGASASHNQVSAALHHKGQFAIAKEIEVPDIVDRVGGGDAAMAGLIAGLLLFDNSEDIINFSVASGAIKHSIHGDFSLASIEEVKALASGQSAGRVSR
ncbi:sugar kinase [Aureibacter tunicatorum]|uniref:2-dehydro-3-deoxygluconokinase n=1 Tax=Aureibacter tunicatorum TaxID=866807 RepID=A0AAE3XMN6_9BACT|nr:sugar kinase [Aureibacter tunicatorum]MDR6239272.1 2-dehydro-3-deoxygluconokinase [Aureibacter tunicatorum]BDD04803.1 2-dehydro-3-deoxygluconokinase [Aureibacter tunicatorum]